MSRRRTRWPRNQGPAIIAIDGPAASGKSSVARRVSAALDFHHVDTGAMYRAATWSVLSKGVDPSDPSAVARALTGARLEYRMDGQGESELLVDGINPGAELKSDEVNAAVSLVARVPEVREILVARQRSLANEGSLVMEGRDIGSVVFPDTPHKFYIDASPEVRAQRRSAEGSSESITKRDEMDKTRKASPLVVAEDAQRIDTSDMTLDEVVVEVLARLRAKGVHPPHATEGERGFVYSMGWRFFRSTARALYDFEVVGAEHVPARGPMLLACNHVSFLDPPMVGIAFPGEIDYVARKTLFRHPFFNWLYRKWRAIPLDQEKPELSTMKTIIRRLQEGNRLLIFPEGERSWDGTLGEGQSGVGFVAARSGAPILPLRIFGPEEAMPRGKQLLRPADITLVVGEPFSFSPAEKKALGSSKDVNRAIADEIMRRIAALELPNRSTS